MASLTLAGAMVQASTWLLPDATITGMPLLCVVCMWVWGCVAGLSHQDAYAGIYGTHKHTNKTHSAHTHLSRMTERTASSSTCDQLPAGTPSDSVTAAGRCALAATQSSAVCNQSAGVFRC